MATILVRKLLNLIVFSSLFYVGLRLIDPAHFISIEYANKFAIWKNGYVGGENYDDLWIILWVDFHLYFLLFLINFCFLFWLSVKNETRAPDESGRLKPVKLTGLKRVGLLFRSSVACITLKAVAQI